MHVFYSKYINFNSLLLLICISCVSLPISAEVEDNINKYMNMPNFSESESKSFTIKKKNVRRFTKLEKLMDSDDFEKAKKKISYIRTKKGLTIYEKAILDNYEGMIYFKQKQYIKSLEKFKKITASPQGLPPTFYNHINLIILRLHFNAKEYDLAIQVINESDEYFKKNASVFIMLGISYFHLKKHSQAKLYLDEGIKISKTLNKNPNRNWFFYSFCNELLQDKPVQAQSYLDEVNNLYKGHQYFIDAASQLDKFIEDKREPEIKYSSKAYPKLETCYF